jgi:FkbM family methyltransferase
MDSEWIWREFNRRWDVNQVGGFRSRLSRWQVVHWLMVQRFGGHRWARGRTFWGDPIYLLTGEPVSRSLLGFGYAEAALTALMLKTIKPGMRFVDVGAHLGYEAVLACRLVGERGRVVSFEPQIQISDWTSRNLRPYSQARLVRSAVGDRNGFLEFIEYDPIHSAFSGQFAAADYVGVRRYDVSVTKLDDALNPDERPVDFIKCDAEGAEMAVLRGSEDVLSVDRPFLVLEAEMPNGEGVRPRIDEFRSFLEPMGYVPLAFEFDGELRLGSVGEIPMGHANIAFFHLSRHEFRDLSSK